VTSEKVQSQTNVPIDLALNSTMAGQTDSDGLSGSSLNPHSGQSWFVGFIAASI